jgi:hypothetical protein
MPGSHHEAAQFLKHVYQQVGPYTQASPAIQAVLQASLAQLLQLKEFWTDKSLPVAVLEVMEEVPLASGAQYRVPFTEAINSGELRQWADVCPPCTLVCGATDVKS